METIDGVICAFLIAQLRGLWILVLAVGWLRRGTSGSPWRQGLEKTNSCPCCCHPTLPVDRPEEVEACQCDGCDPHISS